MVTYQLSELRPGMILAKDAFTQKGQLVVRSGSILTQQMIQHMKYYNIQDAVILPNEVAPVNAHKPERETSYANRIRNNQEFKYFKLEYTQSVNLFQEHLQNFLSGDAPLDSQQLLNDTLRLFNENRTSFSILDMLHNMNDLNDSTYVHSINVAVISRLIGIWSGIEGDDLDVLTMCGLLHDIGKTKIPANILEKPDILTDVEYETIKTHTSLGYEILKDQDLDVRIKNSALMHHERYDGKGYPLRIQGEQIEPFASIVSIADVYDALTSDRCYRDALCPFEVIAMFEKNGLEEYNPTFILPFLSNIAHTYVHHDVRLSDGSTGRIMLINKLITRPLIQLASGDFVNLEERLDLYVEELI